jgi:uncharacterized protein YgbK (DUF1537 family)
MVTPEKVFPNAASQKAAQELAQGAVSWLESHAAAGLVVTGGDTLEALLAALDARGVDLERALAPGIPLGHIAGGPWAGLPIVSKAGSFGEPGALLEMARHLILPIPSA